MSQTAIDKNTELTDNQIKQLLDTYLVDYSRLDYKLLIDWIKPHWEPDVNFDNLRTKSYWFDEKRKMFGLHLVRFEKDQEITVLEFLFTGPVVTTWSNDKKLIKKMFGQVDTMPMQVASWILDDEDWDKIYLKA